MAPSKLRKAIGAVKDKASIGLAKVNNYSESLSDIDVTIVKATKHEEHPPDERHVREILSLTSYSRDNVSACVSMISRRLSKTKNWVVALKTLMLIHRLITNGDQSYEDEIFFSTRRGIRILNMSNFRDTSSSDSWHYSAFVRTYAMYIDEYLELRMQNKRKKHSMYGYKEDGEKVKTNATSLHEMEIEQILKRARLLMRLLERFLACRPTGVAKTNKVVIVALCPIVKESFHLYEDITEIICVLIERFMELDVSSSLKVHEIFCHASKQHEELIKFYGWCNKNGIARPSEYPDVEKISQKKLETMEEYIGEKSRMAKNRKVLMLEPKKPKPELKTKDMKKMIKDSSPKKRFPVQTLESKSSPEEDTKLILALPAPNQTQENADFLNLGEDVSTATDQGDKLALALFDDNSTNSSWIAFNDSTNQQSAPVSIFNQMMLDLLYQQGPNQHTLASSTLTTNGSASSLAFRDTGKPGLLALPAPPGARQGHDAEAAKADPFAASLSVAPPVYVQKSELEKQHQLLVQEQVMWQHYAKEGMQGEVGLASVQHQYMHNTSGGYTYTY